MKDITNKEMLQEALNRAEKEAKQYKREAKQYKSHLAVNDAVIKSIKDIANVQPGAIIDIQARARKLWNLDDGGMLVNDSGYISMEEWVEDLHNDAPFLFKESNSVVPKRNVANPGVKVIHKYDKEEFSRNIYDIASGKVDVR